MTTVALIYPYFRPSNDKSIFRFPPLGLGYIAAYLRKNGISVSLIDCTFLSLEEALQKVRASDPKIIGIQSMYSMKDQSIEMAKLLRHDCEVLVAGGPLPTVCPENYLNIFDIVAVGEGEETMLEIVRAQENGYSLSKVKGIVYNEKGRIVHTPARNFIENLDDIPFPAREFFDNQAYKDYYSREFNCTTTSLITSRGCPFNCEFCSRPVFGNSFRTRSPKNIVDEIENVRELGYNRIWFEDDCFTLYEKRLLEICDAIISRGLKIEWECLSRVDTINKNVVQRMKKAGCIRIFFGIESGNDSILTLMNKNATVRLAKNAVYLVKSLGIQVGAFFIIGYPGETNDTILDTVRFASSLPLDYLSFTLPYPIPGTLLYDRVKNRLVSDEWREPKGMHVIEHKLLYRSSFSEQKLKFAILKGYAQSRLRKNVGTHRYRFLGEPLEVLTDCMFRILR